MLSDAAFRIFYLGLFVKSMRLNEGYIPRSPQVGDLVKAESTRGLGLVIDKKGLQIRVMFCGNTTSVWIQRTTVTIKNRGAK